jgi:hypothetical protein
MKCGYIKEFTNWDFSIGVKIFRIMSTYPRLMQAKALLHDHNLKGLV